MNPTLAHLARLVPLLAACAIGCAYAGTGAPATDALPALGAAHDADADHFAWAVDPAAPGPDLPPSGRSLFDHLLTDFTGSASAYGVPFPFSALVDRIQSRLGNQEYGGGSRVVMVPMGRSLQRTAAAPDFFKYPRIVFAVVGEPATGERDAGTLLKDRLYIGYVEKTGVLEVVSYNEMAGRFEFQLVKGYRAGGRPRVFQANRAICISCHQNHAPIFSGAVWGETNANGRIAQLLAGAGTAFNLSPQANVDFPDDIDKSTVRANALVALQSVWRQGCLDAQNPSRSQRCRAAAFTAVLQYGLSGERDYDSASPAFQSDFVSTLGRTWRHEWPQGLGVGQSSLPDRNPFGGSTGYYGAGAPEEPASDWIAASHVAAELDPLNPRPPREIWRFAGALDTRRFIAGWTRFFAVDDFRALDAHLRQQWAREEFRRFRYRADCTALPGAAGTAGFRLQCASDAAVAEGLNLDGRFDEAGNGRIDWLNLGPAGQLRNVLIEGGGTQRAGPQTLLRGAPKRQGLAARLPDGRALAAIEIRWSAGVQGKKRTKPAAVHVEAVVIDDFAPVHQAVRRLAAKQPALFDNGPLVRASLMRALFAELGMAERSWCCADDGDMPPATLDPPDVDPAALAMREWQPFFRHCAGCHLTREPFPPNFLAGTATRVENNLRRCAPRMLIRLSAWHTPIEQRVKSPMPPAMAVQALGMTTEGWTRSEELEGLRTYLAGLSRQEGHPPDIGELLKGGYESLPRCLPHEVRRLGD